MNGFGIATMLCDFISLLSGEVATLAVVVAILITAILFAIGEAKGIFGTALRIIMAGSVAIGIVTFSQDFGLKLTTYCTALVGGSTPAP